MPILDRKFYNCDTLKVARELLGKKIVRRINRVELSGMIVETEAYCGKTDSACHAHRGLTQRNAVMFGEPGHAYVYFVYGLHYMLNLVTEAQGNPCAVLIRAMIPLTGLDEMEKRRKCHGENLTNGPAKLCQALGIDKSLNGCDLTAGRELWVESHRNYQSSQIIATPRIGIDYSAKEDRDALRRFFIKMN